MKYEGPNSFQSKDIANVKVLADKQTDRRMDRQTDRVKNYIPQVYPCRGIKITLEKIGNASGHNVFKICLSENVRRTGNYEVQGSHANFTSDSQRNELFSVIQ